MVAVETVKLFSCSPLALSVSDVETVAPSIRFRPNFNCLHRRYLPPSSLLLWRPRLSRRRHPSVSWLCGLNAGAVKLSYKSLLVILASVAVYAVPSSSCRLNFSNPPSTTPNPQVTRRFPNQATREMETSCKARSKSITKSLTGLVLFRSRRAGTRHR